MSCNYKYRQETVSTGSCVPFYIDRTIKQAISIELAKPTNLFSINQYNRVDERLQGNFTHSGE